MEIAVFVALHRAVGGVVLHLANFAVLLGIVAVMMEKLAVPTAIVYSQCA